MARAAWRGRIFLDAGALLYVGPGAPAAGHAHNAVQLVWSVDNAFELTVAGRRLQRSAVLVPSAARHALDATGSIIASLLVESHDARGAALDIAARRENYRDLTTALTDVPFPSQ